MLRKKSANIEKINENMPLDGTVRVENGKIIVTNSKDGRGPVVYFGEGISLFVDGKEAVSPVELKSSSRIDVKIHEKSPQRELEVKVFGDGMRAEVLVRYTEGEKFALKDMPPSKELTLKKVSAGIVKCPPYTLEEAVKELNQKGVVFGIQEEKLSLILDGGVLSPQVIAEASLPVDGTDDIVDIKFEDVQKPVELNDRLDFYSIGRVVSVEPGELLAEVIRGEEGKPGMSVLGKEIPQKKGKRLRLKAGRGARVSDDGMKAYSSIMGRPTVRDTLVSVSEVHEVNSDVDISTGNIEFSGDIVVRGNVKEGMKIKAGGRVSIFGSVTGGEIWAGGDVIVQKNIISSTIKAGGVDFVKASLIDIIDSIIKILNSVFYITNALKKTGKVPKSYNDGKIIKMLIDTRYGKLKEKIAELKDTLADNKSMLDMETVRTLTLLIKYFTGNGPLLINKNEDIRTYIDGAETIRDELKEQMQQPSSINANYVQNSKLYSSGDIRLTGRGCYTSNLLCRGNVLIDNRGSIVRGGKIEAGGSVSIFELGSPGGALTSVSAGGNGIITCEIAHINSVVGVGNLSYKLDESVKKLKAYTYKGELMVEKLKL